MFSLLVFQALLSGVGWPSSETPAAFDLIGVIGTIVEMIAHSIVGEAAAAALRHIVMRDQMFKGKVPPLELPRGGEDGGKQVCLRAGDKGAPGYSY